MQIIGYTLLAFGTLFTLVGVFGIFRFNNFYARLLSGANIDTVGLITCLLGVSFLSGFTWFTLKVILILVIILIINPIVTSSMAASAYFSGYKVKKDDKNARR